jgi:hypothetical protein
MNLLICVQIMNLQSQNCIKIEKINCLEKSNIFIDNH